MAWSSLLLIFYYSTVYDLTLKVSPLDRKTPEDQEVEQEPEGDGQINWFLP